MDAGELPLTRGRNLQTLFLALLAFGVIMHSGIWLTRTASDKDKEAFNAHIRGESLLASRMVNNIKKENQSSPKDHQVEPQAGPAQQSLKSVNKLPEIQYEILPYNKTTPAVRRRLLPATTSQSQVAKIGFPNTNTPSDIGKIILETTKTPPRVGKLVVNSTKTRPKVSKMVHDVMKKPAELQKVLILSYQRSGSTYLGDLFGRLPDVFYVYEPLDALYVSLYGSAPGWNVPTDITNYDNGTHRTLPAFERKAVSIFLDNLINCRMTSLPAEIYRHQFWTQFKNEQQSLTSAYACLSTHLRSSGNCGSLLKDLCNERFNSSDTFKNNKCHDNIARMRMAINQSDTRNMSRGVFEQNRRCLLAGDDAITHCKHKLQTLCSVSTSRILKTVRLTMASVKSLIQNNPDIKIIHLIRDPRGVLLSRSKLLSSYGLHSEMLPSNTFSKGYVEYAKRHRIHGGKIAKPGKMSFDREANMYCNTVYSDIVIRKRLEMQYPDVFTEVIFDDFVKDPMTNIKNLYSSIGIKPAENVADSHAASMSISHKWRQELPPDVATLIKSTCQKLYDLVNCSSWNES